MNTKRTIILRATLGLLIGLLGGPGVGHGQTSTLASFVVEVESLADSTQYLVYRYRFANPSSNSGGATTIDLTVSSLSSSPSQLLVSTGQLLDYSEPLSPDVSATPFVPIGVITPVGWKSILSTSAEVSWYQGGGFLTEDSIAPGAAVSGFGLRSPFLPGIRDAFVEPTWRSCCSEPMEPLEENPERIHADPSGMALRVMTIGPTHDPAEFADFTAGIQIILLDAARACSDLSWINSVGACDDIQSNLSAAASAIASATWQDARDALTTVLNTLAAHEGGVVNANALNLLGVNSRFLRDLLPNPPTSAPGGPYAAVEGTSIQVDGSASLDPTGGTPTFSWHFGDGQQGAGVTPVHAYDDNGVYELSLAVMSQTSGLADTASTTVTVSNAPPAITGVTGPLYPVPVGTQVEVAGEFTDAGIADTHTVGVVWGDGNGSGASVAQGAGSGSFSDSHIYASSGVYTIATTVTDDDGGTAIEAFQYAVVYDPNGGFVTGGGWINSPAGAFSPDPAATGKANFGFVSRYQQGAQVPSGETQFRMQAAGLTFHSTEYEWLVVAGARAQFKGVGQLNGTSGFGFMLTAIDSSLPGGGRLTASGSRSGMSRPGMSCTTTKGAMQMIPPRPPRSEVGRCRSTPIRE